MKNTWLLLPFVLISYINISGQCDPPAALDCKSAPVICSLDELDGYTCANPDFSNPTGPGPLCFGQGVPHNTNWWAFVGNGKFLNIVFDFAPEDCEGAIIGCSGIQVGILDDCGGDPLDCNAACNVHTLTLSGETLKCHTYYVWIDGCCSDVCNYTIQVKGGGASRLPNPLPIPKLDGRACPCGLAEVCVENLADSCNAKTQWTIDGIDRPIFDDSECSGLFLKENGSPIEICVTYTIGNPSDTNSICDQATSCIVLTPDSIGKKLDGEIYVCWEDHEEDGYKWEAGDTIIYSSCIDPPCKVRRKDQDGCCVDIEATIVLLPEQDSIEQVYLFICDTVQMPMVTEDGKEWPMDVCGQKITWADTTFYDCDTSYFLFRAVFNPEVNLTTSCPGCNNEVTIYANVAYDPECSFGQTTWSKYWINASGDTIGFGDSIKTKEEGKYFLGLQVNHINDSTGEATVCLVSDSLWYTIIRRDSLAISGDSLFCELDTSTFTLPDAYGNGCDVTWLLEGLDGQIIKDTSKNTSKIEVYWPDDNASDGKICAEIVDTCSPIKKTCKVLKKCVLSRVTSSIVSRLKIYPNPAIDMLYIHGTEQDEIRIIIHDIQGNEISTQPKRAIGGAISIDVHNFAPGIYFIRLSNEKGSKVVKVLIL